MHKFIITLLVLLILVGAGGYWYTRSMMPTEEVAQNTDNSDSLNAVPQGELTETRPEGVSSIGKSVQGRDIAVHTFGGGPKEVLFVGGMHGGYSWNTALVAYELIDHLQKNPTAIPANLRITVIPVMNPDGLVLVVGTSSRFTKADVKASANTKTAARFNGNKVDLNRNFDCEWKASGTWQNTTVSGGASPFSEPESSALKAFVEKYKPAAAVVWYSASGGVFPSTCDGAVASETLILSDTFSEASGYKAYPDFDFYEITGDMPNWLAKNGIPAISVLLTTHEDIEWTKNKKGIEAVLNRYSR